MVPPRSDSTPGALARCSSMAISQDKTIFAKYHEHVDTYFNGWNESAHQLPVILRGSQDLYTENPTANFIRMSSTAVSLFYDQARYYRFNKI